MTEDCDPIRVDVSEGLRIRVNMDDLFASRQYKRICKQADEMWARIEELRKKGMYPK